MTHNLFSSSFWYIRTI